MRERGVDYHNSFGRGGDVGSEGSNQGPILRVDGAGMAGRGSGGHSTGFFLVGRGPDRRPPVGPCPRLKWSGCHAPRWLPYLYADAGLDFMSQ